MMTTVESYRFTAPTRITPQVAKDLPFDLPPARQTTVYVDDEGVEHYTFASAMRENARHWLRQLLEDAGIRDADDRSSVVDTLFNEADDISLTLKMIYDLPAEDTHD